MSEITVILKDSERTLRQKFLAYDVITTDDNDPFVSECINNAKKNFNGDPEEISIRINKVIQ